MQADIPQTLSRLRHNTRYVAPTSTRVPKIMHSLLSPHALHNAANTDDEVISVH